MATNPRLAPLTGITLYGSSAEGATLADYAGLEAHVGQLNAWRAYHPGAGLPTAAAGAPMIWSTKVTDPAVQRQVATAWGTVGWGTAIYHHEPDGKGEYPDPSLWRERAAALASRTPSHIARAACFKNQSVTDGTLRAFLPGPVDWLDMLLVDWYPKMNADGSISLATPDGRWPKASIEDAIDRIAAEAARLGVPWGFGEFGIGGPATWRAEAIDRIIDKTCKAGRFVMWLWFNSSVGQTNLCYDGKTSWRLGAAWDREQPELEQKWRNLAAMTRRQATPAARAIGI